MNEEKDLFKSLSKDDIDNLTKSEIDQLLAKQNDISNAAISPESIIEKQQRELEEMAKSSIGVQHLQTDAALKNEIDIRQKMIDKAWVQDAQKLAQDLALHAAKQPLQEEIAALYKQTESDPLRYEKEMQKWKKAEEDYRRISEVENRKDELKNQILDQITKASASMLHEGFKKSIEEFRKSLIPAQSPLSEFIKGMQESLKSISMAAAIPISSTEIAQSFIKLQVPSYPELTKLAASFQIPNYKELEEIEKFTDNNKQQREIVIFEIKKFIKDNKEAIQHFIDSKITQLEELFESQAEKKELERLVSEILQINDIIPTLENYIDLLNLEPNLAKRLEEADSQYYINDNPVLIDPIYDQFKSIEQSISTKIPFIVSSYTNLRRVGGKASDKFEKVTHADPMLSLGNAFDFDDLKAWDERVKKTTPDAVYSTEVKLDGLAINLRYENGLLNVGATRGDGSIGENVTENLRTIKSIPLKLNDPRPTLIEVRGEVVMHEEELLRLNSEREAAGLPLFANTRNAAAGSVRQLDSAITASRKLDFYAYHVGECSEITWKTQTELVKMLGNLGFKTVPFHRQAETIAQCWDQIEELCAHREKLPFGADGVVIKVDQYDYHDVLGATSHEPRWAIAYKFPPEERETVVTDIVPSVGRTGAITPIAVFEPVLLEGSTVGRASLHNEDEVNRLDIRVLDHIIVRKAGSVIPEVVRVVTEKRTGNEIPFVMPTHCPVCGADTLREEDSAYTRCTNASCPAQVRERILHFASRENANIDGIGDVLVDKLVGSGKVKTIADIYTLTKANLLEFERMGDKLATKILGNIENSKELGLARLLSGLGILMVGKVVAKSIAIKYGSIKTLMDASEDDLRQTDGVGEKIAHSIKVFFEQPPNIELINRLKASDVNMESQIVATKGGKFEGLTFVLTGTLPNLSREQATKIIEDNGGKTSGSVSKKTSYVLAGEEAGSKLDKARELNVPTISEEQFLQMSGEQPSNQTPDKPASLF